MCPIAPEIVPLIAQQAIERGCSAWPVAALAGLRRPDSGDVDPLLDRLLEQIGRRRPTPVDSACVVIDALLHELNRGGVVAEVVREFEAISCEVRDPVVAECLHGPVEELETSKFTVPDGDQRAGVYTVLARAATELEGR